LSHRPIEHWSPAEVAAISEQFQSVHDSLRPRSNLVIAKACFCRSVKSFGNYEPLPEGHAFQAATQSRLGELVQLYIEPQNLGGEVREVRNLAGEMERCYRIWLTSFVEILDHKGVQVWRYPKSANEGFANEEPFLCKSLPKDWYNKYQFRVPTEIPAGTYTLIIHISDKSQSDQPPRLAEAKLEFRVTGAAAAAP
jgi:hypothetical protein